MTTFTRKIVKKDLSKESAEDAIIVLTKAPEEEPKEKPAKKKNEE